MKSTANFGLNTTAIIPCWNRQRDLDKLIESFSILKERPPAIVIDDASDTPLKSARARIVRLKKRAGPSAARNVGLALCDTEYVWFLDSDTEIISPDTLATGLARLRADPSLAGVGAEIHLGRNGERFLYENVILCDYSTLRSFRLLKRRAVKPAGMGSTCNVIMRAAAIREIGGFCEAIHIHEDKLVSLMLRRKGYGFMLDSDMAVIHHISAHARPTDRQYWSEYAGDAAFVFGALSGRVKNKLFFLYVIMARFIELLLMPKLILSHMRIKANVRVA